MDARNFTFMFYGFLAAWLILVAYVVSLVARERRIRREIDNLRQMLGDRERK
ncbi:MAG: CcmD family protein [Bryobacterales bacterium]|nr:CcmD family protein [Bryobacterales bacterium]